MELEEQLAAHLEGAKFGQPVYAFQTIGSTMDVAHQLVTDGAPEGTLVWAGSQARGRGRLGRSWTSPEGGLYCSIIVRPSRAVSELPQLSLVAGLAASDAIEELTGLVPSVRWPNDLQVQGKKVAGILTERRNGAVVMGIGMNVRTALDRLPDASMSLAAAGKPVDSKRLTGLLCRYLSRWYEAWHRHGFAPIREALRPRLALLGEVVHLQAGSEALDGTAQGLDEAGRLLIRLESGLMRAVDVGEVTHVR